MADFIGRTYKIRTCDQRIKSRLHTPCTNSPQRGNHCAWLADGADFAHRWAKIPPQNTCTRIQPVRKYTLSSVPARGNLKESLARGFVPGNRTVLAHGKHLARDFCFPPSGRELTQLTGQCRGRTHVPMALCEPRRQRPCHRDRDEQARRPIYPNGPRHGRLEVECERSAGGSCQQYSSGRRHHREPRGSLSPLGLERNERVK
jgi:hypothetical protein